MAALTDFFHQHRITESEREGQVKEAAIMDLFWSWWVIDKQIELEEDRRGRHKNNGKVKIDPISDLPQSHLSIQIQTWNAKSVASFCCCCSG